MITGSDTLGPVLRAGGYGRSWVCDVICDGDIVLRDQPLLSCELKSKGNARIRTQGTAELVYADAEGVSIVPDGTDSWLTPYATFLNVSMLITAGDFSEKVLQGVLKVVGVGDPEEAVTEVNGVRVVVGSKVRLELADHFAVTDRERFIAPGSPSQTASVTAEIAVLTGLPLQTAGVVDKSIDREVTYKENRLDAVFDLAAILAATPYMDPDGYVAFQPDEWPDESEALLTGPEGTVIKAVPAEWTDEGVYNQVVVRSYDDEQGQILGDAKLPSGPLRYGGPFGRVPFFASSPYVTTVEQGQAYAEAQLPKVSTAPAEQFFIQCVPDPRREVGDVVPFTHNDVPKVGRIVERTLAGSGPMTLKVSLG